MLGGKYLFQVYKAWGASIVFIFGLTPLPYKLVTVTAGVAKVNLAVFMIASIVARALRFFLVAWILKNGVARRSGLSRSISIWFAWFLWCCSSVDLQC